MSIKWLTSTECPAKDSAKALRQRTPPTLKEKLEVLPRVLPFLLIIAGVLYVLYGGVATPSEASGVGAFLVFVLIAVVYKIYQPKKIWNIIKVSMKESVMIMFIIAASYFFSFTLSQLYVTQSLAQSMIEISANKWVIFFLINIFLLVAGFFLPPVAVIVMTSAILLPVITTLEQLDEEALITILTEPKNSLTKQFSKLFEMEEVELDIREDALSEIAKKAIERKTGARGLRSILENILMETMYKVPSEESLNKVVLDGAVVRGESEPLMVYEKTSKTKTG